MRRRLSLVVVMFEKFNDDGIHKRWFGECIQWYAGEYLKLHVLSSFTTYLIKCKCLWVFFVYLKS